MMPNFHRYEHANRGVNDDFYSFLSVMVCLTTNLEIASDFVIEGTVEIFAHNGGGSPLEITCMKSAAKHIP